MPHHNEDKLFKIVNEVWAKEFGELINISLKNYRPIPTELIEETGDIKHIDAGWESENNIITMEFQSTTPNRKDRIRFLHYTCVLLNKTGKYVQINVICTSEVKKPENLKNVKNEFFEISYIHFKNIDGDKKLNKIKNKLENNKILNESDFVELIVIPLMGTKYDTVIQLEKVIDLTNEKTISDKEKLEKIKKMQILLVDKFVKNRKKLNELMRKINMSTDAWELYNKELKDEGIEEGIEKNKLEVAKTMLSKDFSIEDIMEITKLTRNKVISLK